MGRSFQNRLGLPSLGLDNNFPVTRMIEGIAKSVLLCVLIVLPARGADIPFSAVQQVMVKHCIKCHGHRGKVKGDVNLMELKTVEVLKERTDLLETIIEVIEEGEMPPEDEPQLSSADKHAVTAHLKKLLKESLAKKGFAHTPIRRMNRFQYNNSVVDLFGAQRDVFHLPENLMRRYTDYFHPETGEMPTSVRAASRSLSKDVDNSRQEGFMGVASFPQDLRAEHGYDNRADHLSLSPLLMESFLKLSQTIVESKDLNPKECRNYNRLFAAPADESKQVEEIRDRLSWFLRRAFRRPAGKSELDRFVQFAQQQLKDGVSFVDAMKTIVGATFASPDFLYLYDSDEGTEAKTRKLNEFELASRLSFFLWGGGPDDELLDLAEQGKLGDQKTFSGQITRMMNDRRMVRFCDAFPSQWMQLDRLISALPDPKKYPHFYYNNSYRVSMHMMLEPLLLFETVFIENRSVMDLIAPDFSWQSRALRGAYEGKITDRTVNVMTFERVPVTDPRRGGIITSAAVLTMTSGPKRTLPITRGAWMNTVIFNDPPDPPPADVPPLPKANEDELAKLTLRERFEAHRKREDCAGCHRQIDPLGFALENYDPTGIWREKYENGREVDPSGELFGEKFETLLDFRALLRKEQRRFVRALTGHLLYYALGRELTAADSPTLDKIADHAMKGDDRLRTLMKQVAMSEPFRHKNTSHAQRQDH